jgi:polyisoprenoid-binding protein YceI
VWSFLATLTTAVPALAQPSVLPAPLLRGTLSFDARATLGDFTGTTASVSGSITGGPSLEEVRGWVEAPVDSLRTGNGLRDRDMRKSLEAGRFSTIRFELDEIRPSPMQGNQMVATLVGRFTIHGVTRTETLPATLTWTPEEIRVEATLAMDVRDYEIGHLSKLLGTLRMHPDIIVRVDLWFAREAP